MISYGFKQKNEAYIYSKSFMNDAFRAEICIDRNGHVSGKGIELELGEEYTNFRMEYAIGEFVNEYIKILQDIVNNCFEK